MSGSTPLHGEDQAAAPGLGRGSLAARRAVVFAAIWSVLSEGDLVSWQMGAPCVLVATLAAGALSPRRRWRVRPLGVAAFIPFFLYRTVIGSVDVAWRALHPRMPIDPELIYYQLRLPAGPGRLLFASTINLLPGTVSASLVGDRLLVHVIDRTRRLDAELETFELRVAAMLSTPEARK